MKFDKRYQWSINKGHKEHVIQITIFIYCYKFSKVFVCVGKRKPEQNVYKNLENNNN